MGIALSMCGVIGLYDKDVSVFLLAVPLEECILWLTSIRITTAVLLCSFFYLCPACKAREEREMPSKAPVSCCLARGILHSALAVVCWCSSHLVCRTHSLGILIYKQSMFSIFCSIIDFTILRCGFGVRVLFPKYLQFGNSHHVC